MAFVRRIICLPRTGLRRHVASSRGALDMLIPGFWMVLLEISGCSLQNQQKQKCDQTSDRKFLLRLYLWLSILQKFWLRDTLFSHQFTVSQAAYTLSLSFSISSSVPDAKKKNAQRYIRLKMKLIFVTHTSVSNTKPSSASRNTESRLVSKTCAVFT